MTMLRSGTALLTLALLALGGCGGSDNDSPQVTPTPTPTVSPAPEGDADSDGITDAEDNCPDDANADQVDSDVDGMGDVCDPIPSQYVFLNDTGANTVSYTGQTHRHILIDDLATEMVGLVEDAELDVVGSLNFYFRFNSATSDDLQPSFDLTGETLLPQNDASQFTYGAISSNKDLVGKIAGGDGEGGGEASILINDEFFGWTTGLDASPLPVELVDYWFERLATEATDNASPQIPTASGSVALDTVTVDAWGVDYRQLVQKFLLGAVTFSQGTADYLKADFATMLSQEGSAAYTEAEHNWDEAFGYFGAARDYGDYTDNEIRAGGTERRAEYANGYYDSNGDGAIDIRSEFNFGLSTNCAKRDAGTAANTNPTNFTQTTFDAFLLGREILKNAASSGSLSADAQAALDAQALIAAQTWEQCIAATVVHYINDTLGAIASFDTEAGTFADLSSFKNLAKYWSEMKGFALGLQFNPESPFRADDSAVEDLRQVLSLMGDAPVLADGTQAGEAFAGGVEQYVQDLEQARLLLETTYGFDSENVANW